MEDSREKIEKIQEKFLNDLLALKVSQEEAIKISSTFFLSWSKVKGIENKFDYKEYEKDITKFLSRFKETLHK